MKNKIIKFLSLILLFLYIAIITTAIKANTTSNGVVWNDNGVSEKYEQNYISLPCFTAVNFSANTTHQFIDIYNPEQNNCYMNFSIYIDDTLVWSENNVYPNHGYHEIDITHQLSKGTYDAVLKVQCFDIKTDQELNGGLIDFKIYSD